MFKKRKYYYSFVLYFDHSAEFAINTLITQIKFSAGAEATYHEFTPHLTVGNVLHITEEEFSPTYQ